MKKAFTLVESCISVTLILLIIGSLTSLHVSNIKTYKETVQRDVEFNIARAVCEKFKAETLSLPEKCVVIYIDSLWEISDDITNILINKPNLENISYDFVLAKNTESKKFALILKSSNQIGLSILKVSVLAMDGSFIKTDLKVTKNFGEIVYE